MSLAYFLDTYFIEYLRMVPLETQTQKHPNYAYKQKSIQIMHSLLILFLSTSNIVEEGGGGGGRGECTDEACVLMKRNCILFHLIIILRESNQARFELFSKIFSFFNPNLSGCSFHLLTMKQKW